MRKRTLAREFALQILYQLDITRDNCDAVLDNFWLHTEDNVDEAIKNFANDIVRGVVSNLDAIDAKITQYAVNWHLKRMAVVDRNVLRVSCYELVFRSDIPPKVSINEAVDMAKKFSGIEAGKFVNGILDKIKQEKKA